MQIDTITELLQIPGFKVTHMLSKTERWYCIGRFESAACHIFVLSIVSFPIPGNAEFLGEFRPMPMGVLVHEALDTLDIRGRDAVSTYCHGCFHDWSITNETV